MGIHMASDPQSLDHKRVSGRRHPDMLLLCLAVLVAVGCRRSPEVAKGAEPAHAAAPEVATEPPAPTPSDGGEDMQSPAPRAKERAAMVRTQIEPRGIEDRRVLAAMRKVPRHQFVPPGVRREAYDDHPLPIGDGQTISQPFIVAAMTELAQIGPESKVLEIGTGSGYQAAVLAEIAAEVYSIEIVAPLARRARATLESLGYQVHLRVGDGYAGWPEAAPFDAILVTAAPPKVPKPLKDQLAIGGRMVIPVGEVTQELLVIERTSSGFRRLEALPVRFVPMTGKAQQP